MGFTKLDSGIVDSSIWDEDGDTCKVWVTLLALSDAEGFVRGSPGWLARKSKVALEKCDSALLKFLSPDPASRNPTNEGRRIKSVDNGWRLLNHADFRQFSYSSKPSAVRMRKLRASHTVTCDDSCHISAHSASASVSASGKEGVQGKETIYSANARAALHFLNEQTSSHFRECESSLAPINSRMNESGVTLEGVKQMIKRQYAMWKGTRFEEYLRPSTLFGKEKFNEYYAAKDQPIRTQADKPNPRNNGVVIGPTNYATAKPRAQREREESEARILDGKMAAHEDHPSRPTNGA